MNKLLLELVVSLTNNNPVSYPSEFSKKIVLKGITS